MTRQKFVFGLVDRQWDGSFVHCEGHHGLGRACNMKVCALGSDSMLWEHILLFNSWSSRSRSCDQHLFPCFHTSHFTHVGRSSEKQEISFFQVMEAKCSLFNVRKRDDWYVFEKNSFYWNCCTIGLNPSTTSIILGLGFLMHSETLLLTSSQSFITPTLIYKFSI